MCDKFAYSIDETAKRLSLSRDLVNILIRRDEPRLVKVGSRRIVRLTRSLSFWPRLDELT